MNETASISACNNNPIDKFDVHIEIKQSGITAIDILAENTSLSRQKIKQAMQKGAVWITRGSSTNRIRRATKTLNAGQQIHLYYDPMVLSQKSQTPELLADKKDYSVWFKPGGMLSQGTKYGDHCTIYRWAESQLKPQRPTFLVHRLDKATQGVIIIAHSKKAARIFSAMFSGRSIQKYYKAIVHGIPEAPVPITIDTPLEGKNTLTKIHSVLANRGQHCSLLDIQIFTGRKHQIRQHLAGQGFPIVGDRLYGQGYSDKLDLCLMAYRLAFISPFNNEAMDFQVPEQYLLNYGKLMAEITTP